jgi:hypothetical protein
MKYPLSALALLFLLCISASGQVGQPKQQEKESPGLDETIKWLSQNLPSLASYEGVLKGFSITNRVVSATFDGCSCTLSTREEYLSTGTVQAGSRTSDNYIFSLASLDAEKVWIQKVDLEIKPLMYWLNLPAKDGKKAIKNTTLRQADLLRPSSYDVMTSSLILKFDNEENVHRLEKAFKHAIKLCQSRSKEPF